MRHLFLIYFIINLLNVQSQSFDSLIVEAAKLPHDTAKVNLFYNQGFLYRATNTQYSYDCARQAENMAQRTGQALYIAKASNLLGILFYRKGDLNTALSYHKKALNLRVLINDKKGIALSQTNLGNIYSDLGQYKRAEEAYLAALQINNDLGLAKQIDNCLLNLGVLSAELKLANVAENYFTRAMANAKKRYDYDIESACLNNLAVINTMKQDYDAAIANCLNSIKLKTLMDNEMEMADSYLTIAVAYIKKKEALPALENLKIADSIILKFNYLAAKVASLKAYSEYYALEKNYEAAFAAVNRSARLKDSLEKVNKEINLENSFIETEIMTQAMDQQPAQKFPLSVFIVLCVLAILSGLFIFKFKR